MPSTYRYYVEMDGQSSPYFDYSENKSVKTTINTTEDKTHKYADLLFYKGKDSMLPTPQSIMNEHVGINYRTIYNGFAVPTNGNKMNSADFTLYDDYLRCTEVKNTFTQYLTDKRNPTYANILKYYNDENFDPHGIARYKMQDFIYLKYYNQIPNNHMITLRRYANPIDDHIVGLDYNAVSRATINNLNDEYFALATAVTYMGEQTGNKLSDILKFEYGAKWENKTAQVQQLKSTDGGLAAQMTDKWNVSQETLAGVNKAFDLKGSLMMGVIGAARGTNPAHMQSSQHQFEQNEFLATYGEQFYGDINSITETNVRARGLTFTNEFTLNFEYSLKSLKCVNPRVAMMDILSNFLILTGNYGSFWGGATIYYGARTIGPQFGNPALLRQGKYGEYLNSLASDVRTSFDGFKQRHSDKDGNFSFKGLLGGLGEILQGGLQALLGNLLGGNIGVAGEAQAPQALLSGKPTGFWHLTIGNPLDPIAMMGNMKIESTTVQFNDILGYDDFPTEIKFTVKLSHGKPRDNAGIENMFNGNKGRFYVFSKDFEKALDLPDNYTNGMIKPGGTQETTGSGHTGNSASGPFTNGKLSIIGSLLK